MCVKINQFYFILRQYLNHFFLLVDVIIFLFMVVSSVIKLKEASSSSASKNYFYNLLVSPNISIKSFFSLTFFYNRSRAPFKTFYLWINIYFCSYSVAPSILKKADFFLPIFSNNYSAYFKESVLRWFMSKINFQLGSPPKRSDPSFAPVLMLHIWQQQSNDDVMKA